jgi:hypothetical protein
MDRWPSGVFLSLRFCINNKFSSFEDDCGGCLQFQKTKLTPDMDNGYGYASFQILVFPLVLDEGSSTKPP